jgi:membrane protein
MATTVATAEREHGWAFWWHVVVATAKNFFDPDTSPRCAGAAFFGFLSFFPAIATVALIVGLVLDPAMLRGAVSVLQYVLPAGALGILEEQLQRLAAQPNTTLGIGLLISIPLALWSGSRGVDALLFALSQVRGQKERRGFVMQVVIAVGTTIVGGLFVVIALLTVAGLPALIPFPSGEELLVLLLRWPVLMVLTVIVFALLYRFGPDRHPHRFRFVWPGAVLASTLWILAGAVFSIYVENFGNYEVTFGSVSAAVVLLLWMYNSTQILVIGAAFNTELQRAVTGEPKREVESRDAQSARE